MEQLKITGFFIVHAESMQPCTTQGWVIKSNQTQGG